MAKRKVRNEISWPTVVVAEELPLVIPATGRPNPAHELQRLLASRIGHADGSIALPEPSRVAVAIETIVSGVSRAAGPVLLVLACTGIAVAVL